MAHLHLSVDAYVYTPVITSLGINRQIEKAEYMYIQLKVDDGDSFKKAVSSGCATVVTHNAILAAYARVQNRLLIDGFIQNGDIEKLQNHIDEMIKEGIQVNTETYRSCY